jgi:hypothetical protein
VENAIHQFTARAEQHGERLTSMCAIGPCSCERCFVPAGQYLGPWEKLFDETEVGEIVESCPKSGVGPAPPELLKTVFFISDCSRRGENLS